MPTTDGPSESLSLANNYSICELKIYCECDANLENVRILSLWGPLIRSIPHASREGFQVAIAATNIAEFTGEQTISKSKTVHRPYLWQLWDGIEPHASCRLEDHCKYAIKHPLQYIQHIRSEHTVARPKPPGGIPRYNLWDGAASFAAGIYCRWCAGAEPAGSGSVYRFYTQKGYVARVNLMASHVDKCHRVPCWWRNLYGQQCAVQVLPTAIALTEHIYINHLGGSRSMMVDTHIADPELEKLVHQLSSPITPDLRLRVECDDFVASSIL